MECTQRLECTQELNYGSNSDRICPEQIGFLGICGTKYPVVKGPNKIGRDPQMCNIVLNLNSISRQHAVVNILNNKQFMLMDLDSANKTKVLDKTLPPYIPHPLKNGDTVQFGDVFGIFRLLDEDDELPMTQAIDIPDTPIHTRLLSRMNTITTIPESPDASDKDDSLLISTQFKGGSQLKTSNEHFIKYSGKTVSIQPVGLNKIDNIFWNSSKKSNSFNLSLNNSRNSLQNSDAYTNNKENNDIHEMETQVPYSNPIENLESIFEAQTQIPSEDHNLSQSIHNIETQIPTTEHLPEVCKIPEQCEMKLNLYTNTKENVLDIHQAETQEILPREKIKDTTDENDSIKENHSTDCSNNETKQKLNASEEELLFNDITSQSFEDDFESQCLLPKVSLSPKPHTNISDNTKNEIHIEKLSSNIREKVACIESGSSTDCDDLEFLPTQKISEIQTDDGDETDCEDILNENTLIKSKTESLANEIKIKVNPGKIVNNNNKICKQNDVCFEDMLTQIVDVKDSTNNSSRDEVDFADLPTQVVDEIIPNNAECIEYTQQFSEEIISPFKRPLRANSKVKIKQTPKLVSSSLQTKSDITESVSDRYYQDTQDIFDDLCSQKVVSAEGVDNSDSLFKKPMGIEALDNTRSFQNNRTGITFGHIESKTLTNSNIEANSSKQNNEEVKKFVSSLTTQQIRDVIGISSVCQINRKPGDSSEESTPRKLKPSKLMDIDFPNSQEIKASVNTVSKTLFTELSSESESENNSEEQYTPILHRKRIKSKNSSKIRLANKLSLESLPTRVITRNRKPTAKYELGKKTEAFLTEHDDDIDKEIITENISRLKSNFEKNKFNRNSDSDRRKPIVNKTENSLKTLNKIDTKSSDKKLNNPQDSEKKIEVKNENTTNKTRSGRSTRSSRTKHKSESENKPVQDDKNKQQLKINDKGKLQDSSKKTKTEPLLSTSSSKSTTRSSRNKTQNDTHSVSPKIETEKSRRRQKNQDKDVSRDEVVEIRRSKRQRTTKDKKETEFLKPDTKSILKRTKTNDSTVYDVSSEFEGISNKSKKRSAVDDKIAPSSKRTRSSANSSIGSLRSTPARTVGVQRILFTAFPSDEVKQQLENIGAIIVSDVIQCSVVLTIQIKRTFKLLCAVGLGLPIVGPNWVQACVDTKIIVDPWLYIIKDEAAEKRFAFNLERTLRGKRNFLDGYNVSSTPGVLPNAAEMKLIVECSGGKWKEEGPRWVCVSSPADKALWPSLKRRGAAIVTTEFILAGVLRQKVDIEANQFK